MNNQKHTLQTIIDRFLELHDVQRKHAYCIGRSMEHYGALSISRTAHLKRGGRNYV